MRLLFVLGAPLTYSQAPSSRLIYIANSIKKKSLSIELMGFKAEELHDLKTTTVIGIKHIARIKLLATLYRKAAALTYTHIIIRGASFAFFLIPLRITGTKIFLDFHGWMYREINLYYQKNLYNRLKVAIYYVLEKMAVRFSDILICTGRGAIELLDENGKKKTIIIENGLNIKEAQDVLRNTEKERDEILEKYLLPESKPLLGFMGNWERHLDMELVFKACKIAGIKMIVVGEGPGIDLFRERWKENITFTGRLPRIEGLKIISLCDATIVPYKEDYAVPVGYFSTRKVKDYLGLGKPILMANVRGRERFLVPYENAVFYHPDNLKDLAEKMKIVVYNKKLRKKISENNLKLARRFDWQILVEKSGLLKILEN